MNQIEGLVYKFIQNHIQLIQISTFIFKIKEYLFTSILLVFLSDKHKQKFYLDIFYSIKINLK